MFTKIPPTTDIPLSNEAVADLVVTDALKNIRHLTGLNQQQAFALLVNKVSQQTNQVSEKKVTKVETPLVEQNEAQFISSLFS